MNIINVFKHLFPCERSLYDIQEAGSKGVSGQLEHDILLEEGEGEMNGGREEILFFWLKQRKIPSQRHGIAGSYEIWVLS